MEELAHFKNDFAEAAAHFRQTAENAGLEVTHYAHPLKGPGGESLQTDTTFIGDPQSPNLVVLISGTHGVETLCGSACQSAFLSGNQIATMPKDTAVLMIHGLNCWGASHLRRNNEDNVDLSRNFLDFSKPLPVNAAYEEIHQALCCPQHEGIERDNAQKMLGNFVKENGVQQYVAALMGGQYQHARGFAYGGDGAVWSHRLLKTVLEPFADSAQKVSAIEYHSGLGPWAYGTAVTMQTGADLKRIRQNYGGWVEAPNDWDGKDDQHYFQPKGHPTEGLREVFPDAQLNAIVLEYGTYPPMESLPVLLDDHWLTHYGEPTSELGLEIKSKLLEMHYPANPDWRLAVAHRSTQVIDQTFRSLRNP